MTSIKILAMTAALSLTATTIIRESDVSIEKPIAAIGKPIASEISIRQQPAILANGAHDIIGIARDAIVGGQIGRTGSIIGGGYLPA